MQIDELVEQQNCNVAQVWDDQTLKLTFRRCVDVNFLDECHDLLVVLSKFIPSKTPNKPIWTLEQSGVYSVHSFYNIINWEGVSAPIWEKFWKIKVPPRYLVFVWLAFNNKILTKDNLVKRQHLDDLTCLFCGEAESVQHLFFGCLVAKEVWKTDAEVFQFNSPCSMSNLSALWCMNT